MKIYYKCWSCNKEYCTSTYSIFAKQDKNIQCTCGGYIVTPSGKVQMTRK